MMAPSAGPAPPAPLTLRMGVPWWAHPAWALLAITGTTAWAACWLTDQDYEDNWGVRKWIDTNLAQVLAWLIAATLVGLVVAAIPGRGARQTSIHFTADQIAFLERAYRALLLLAVLGYTFWVAVGVANGVDVDHLAAVLDRGDGAISQLKRLARPVAGLTTLTQFGPVAVALGVLLRRLGQPRRGFWWLFALAGVRTLFYAERLALMEVAIPALLIVAATVPETRRPSARLAVQSLPFVAGPGVWLLFAVSEYGRNWIHHQATARTSFLEWVTTRFAGYYTTCFNNSALIARRFPTFAVDPYFSFSFFWDAPGVDQFASPGLINGMSPGSWWAWTRTALGNPEFTNTGSFLTTFAELDFAGALAYWLVVGVVFGRLHNGLRSGQLSALLAHACLFVTILELPRFIYIVQGRATPVVLALAVIALAYPKPLSEPAATPGVRWLVPVGRTEDG